MPALQIDGQKISIDEGRTILDAARQAGIEIPTLCWYPTLSIVGNCRICLVSVEGQPKLIPACAAKVRDGLVVTTRSHDAPSDPSCRENRELRLSLLWGRLPGRLARREQRDRARDVAGHRVEYAEPGIDLRQGTLRLRLSPAPRPTAAAADSKRVDQGKRPLVMEGTKGSRSARRTVAHDRGRRPPPQA